MSAGTHPEARAGNTDRWSKSKLPTDTAYGTIRTNAEIDARIEDWAREGNTDDIPASKLDLAGGNYKGTWASGTAYAVGDLVAFDDKFYIAETARATTDTTDPDDDDAWLDITVTQAQQLGMIIDQGAIQFGNTDIEIPVGNGSFGAWTLVTNPAVGPGAHIISFQLAMNELAQTWLGVQFRLVRQRFVPTTSTTTLHTTPVLRYNARGPATLTGANRPLLYANVTEHFESIGRDVFRLEARAIADNAGVGTTLLFPAADQYVEQTTIQPAASSAVAIDDRIEPEARAGNTDRWGKDKLPTDTAYGTIPNNAAIDARIATFARQGATINIPDANLPTILRGLPSALGTSGQVLAVNSGATALEFADASGGGSEITDYIRTGTALPTSVTAESPDDFYVRGDGVYEKESTLMQSRTALDLGNVTFTGPAISSTNRTYVATAASLGTNRRYVESMQVNVVGRATSGTWEVYLAEDIYATDQVVNMDFRLSRSWETVRVARQASQTKTYDGRTYTLYRSAAETEIGYFPYYPGSFEMAIDYWILSYSYSQVLGGGGSIKLVYRSTSVSQTWRAGTVSEEIPESGLFEAVAYNSDRTAERYVQRSANNLFSTLRGFPALTAGSNTSATSSNSFAFANQGGFYIGRSSDNRILARHLQTSRTVEVWSNPLLEV